MGKLRVPILNDTENAVGRVSRRVPLRRSKSFDASFWECHAMLKPIPSTLELEKSQWIIYHQDSPSCNGYIIPDGAETHPPTSDASVWSRLAYLKRNCKDQDYRIWNNWDAALISLKIEEEKKIATTSYPPKQINFARDVVKKECRCAVCSSSSSGKECERLVMVGKAVTALTQRAISFVNLNVFEYRLSAEKYDEVRSSLFQNVAKSVLAIFDMEDFERIYQHNHVKGQYEYVSENFPPEGLALLHDWNFRHHTREMNALQRQYTLRTRLKDVLHFQNTPRTRQKKVLHRKYTTHTSEHKDALRDREYMRHHGNYKNLCSHAVFFGYDLKEPDVCDIMRQYELSTPKERSEVSPWLFLDEKHSAVVRESDFNDAMLLMKDYTPMKESYDVQLSLELTRGKCFHVFDTLVTETLAYIPLDALFEYVGYQKQLIVKNKKMAGLEKAFRDFVEGVVNGLHDLAALKSSALNHFQSAVTFPISVGHFGPCTEEVVEVMKLADFKRRKEARQFISLQNVLFGLSFSRLGFCIELLKGGEQVATTSTLFFYEKVRSLSGHGSLVNLEDLVAAVLVLGKYATDREILRRQIFELSEEAAEKWAQCRRGLWWEDPDVFSEVGLEWTEKGAKMRHDRGEDFIKALRHHSLFCRHLY